MLNVAFLLNGVNHRGTTWAVYEYAKALRRYQKVLPMVFSLHQEPPNPEMMKRFALSEIPVWNTTLDTDFGAFEYLYHIKYGNDDGWRPKNTKYLVHAVFDVSRPHGDCFAGVSKWLCPDAYVNHIIHPNTSSDRPKKDRIKVGWLGGPTSFDIEFAKPVLLIALEKWPQLSFYFMGAESIGVTHERIRCKPVETMPWKKRDFIASCNAMIHARGRGETFGIAVGEFAVANKPVITYRDSGEKAHLDLLQPDGGVGLYWDAESLLEAIGSVVEGRLKAGRTLYHDCTAEKVARQFMEVFIK
jgi:hypothetical protein